MNSALTVKDWRQLNTDPLKPNDWCVCCFAIGVPRDSGSRQRLFAYTAFIESVFVMEVRCVLWGGVNRIFVMWTHVYAYNSRSVTWEARVRFQAGPRENFGDTLRHVFSPSTWVFPRQYHSTNAPYSCSSTRCCYRDTKQCSFGSRRVLDRKLLSFVHSLKGLKLICYFTVSLWHIHEQRQPVNVVRWNGCRIGYCVTRIVLHYGVYPKCLDKLQEWILHTKQVLRFYIRGNT